MINSNTYNHQHKLSKLAIGIRVLYYMPAFVLVLLGQSLIFNFGIALFYVLMSNYMSRLGVGRIIKMYMAPFVFILMGCLPILFSVNHGRPLITIKLFFIGWSEDGLRQSMFLISRCIALISIVFGSLQVLSVSDICLMMQKLRVPSILIELFMFTYKFIENLTQISQHLFIAQKSRLAYSNQYSKIQSFSLLMNSIFQNALIRQQYLNEAIESRGGYNTILINKEVSFRINQLIQPVSLAVVLLFILLKVNEYGW